jgi:hypothetical protein
MGSIRIVRSVTPERLLARVEQLEDIELPSLPSFQHDDPDFESGIITEAESSLDASDYSKSSSCSTRASSLSGVYEG